ncbi:MAG TPA: TetR/AcrR family transcriptional regulator, partial [Ktedonobacteraceae bacterium]|nr:TetR/AcrR family transcriptional regulator [Ktedonobacteraceae bacterium]
MSRNTHSTRQHILEAAAKVVQSEGVARLTLEAVAKAAGVSKGGVLYHFATKEALVEGMLGALFDHFTHDLDTEIAHNESAPGQWARAYIRASTYTVEGEDEVLFGLLA